MFKKIRLLSDLHLEWYSDQGDSFINSLETDEEEILVLAGDITSWNRIEAVLTQFCAKFKEVVYVLGNHEYYGAPSRTHVLEECFKAQNKNSNLHWLNNSKTCIDGKWFYGGTMWFRLTPQTKALQYGFNDFHKISKLNEWVYQENYEFCKFIENVSEGDVVVTHHLPSEGSVSSLFKTSKLNAFFVCDLEGVMSAFQPSIWLHGHTHSSFDYIIDKTRVVCNPFGYFGHSLNNKFDSKLIIECLE